MDCGKRAQKPALHSDKSLKKVEDFSEKLEKIRIFYRYRLPSIYRDLRTPIYDTLLASNNRPILKMSKSKNIEEHVEILYKKATMNSKYYHRDKMRFSRTSLLKYIQYDFQRLQEKLKSKNYCKIYDDLEDSDEDGEGKQAIEYQVNSQFSQQTIARYKKKNNITGRIVSSRGYDDMKQRLINAYGWVQNTDPSSLIYDFKHMSKKKNIDYVNLLDSQRINHFNENKAITAKFGLCRNIRNIVSLNKDPSQFFPRCFDVNDVAELQNFYENFKETYVQSIVKKYVKNKGIFSHNSNTQKMEEIISLCIKLLEIQIMPMEVKIGQIQNQHFISRCQWDLICQYEKQEEKKGEKGEEKKEEKGEEKKGEEKGKQEEGKQEEGKQEKTEEEKGEHIGIPNKKLWEHAVKISQQMQKYDPQWGINTDNIWIIKPASMSRGRGIKTFNNMTQIFDYVIGKQISWVAQKYIENPLILKKRKFDIRQWVVLTDFKPFRVWIYDECYIRFCASLYTSQNLKDRKVHLTNNSVTKGISQIKDGIEQNMMSQKQFSQLLSARENGKQIFRTIIRPQIERISVEALESVKENMVPRKNTLEIFGFDFMIDDHYKVWLIEVNSSPTMEHSTKVTAKIVQKGMSDFADLVENYMFKGKVYNQNKADQLYGGWKLLTNKG